MKPAQPVNVGIAGLGRSGWEIHAHLLSGLEGNFRIAAAFDALPERLTECAERFGCRTSSDYGDFLHDDGVELVVVATPSHLHPEHAIRALKAGKHVVCEKPMAATVAEANRMIRAATRARRVLTVFQNYRYAPAFRTVKRVIESGCLGRIVLIRMAAHRFGRRWDWQTLKRFGGGSLNNTGPHLLDRALLLFGEEKPRLYCRLERALTLGDADDHVKVILSGKNSPSIEVEITSACPYPQDPWLIMGTRGGLTGTDEQLRWRYFDPAGLPERHVDPGPVPGRAYNREEIPWIEEGWRLEEDSGPGEKGFYLDLYETLRNGRPLEVTPESVRRQIGILERCHRLCPV
jgi:scyllo-inositol 2-dehydrogenase (NADP+)